MLVLLSSSVLWCNLHLTLLWQRKHYGAEAGETCRAAGRSRLSASLPSPSSSSCLWPPVSIPSPPPIILTPAKTSLYLNVHFKAWSCYALIIFSGGCCFFPKCLWPVFVRTGKTESQKVEGEEFGLVQPEHKWAFCFQVSSSNPAYRSQVGKW